jgi:hypothetical protein
MWCAACGLTFGSPVPADQSAPAGPQTPVPPVAPTWQGAGGGSQAPLVRWWSGLPTFGKVGLVAAVVVGLGLLGAVGSAMEVKPTPSPSSVAAVTASPTPQVAASPTASADPTASATPTLEPTPTPIATPTPTPAPTFLAFGDGTWEVGTDIQPGTYRTREGSGSCYWARLSGFGGSLGEIIANENSSGPAVVTISSKDKGFESRRCGTWTKDLSALDLPIGDGTWIVGTDLPAGTYRNSGGDMCYWARIKGFSGALGDIIANDNVDGTTIVSIKSTDKGFISARCGAWTKK